jgi:hypothetical protein
MADEGYSDLGGLIGAAFAAPLVTKWVVVAEVIDEDGDKCMQSMRSEDLPTWDFLGMLQFQLIIEKQRLDTFSGDED